MTFDLAEARAALERGPAVLRDLVSGVPLEWLAARPTPEDWDARAVVCHLVYVEESDWLVRTRMIVEVGPGTPFPPVEHGDQTARYPGVSAAELVDRFADLRAANLGGLDTLDVGPDDLDRTGTHPTLGEVTLRQLLATWVVHDHNHLRQLQEALAAHYVDEVGPWRAHLGVLDRVTH
ncbi:MAG TPA: DinB family protein [Candidatus Limnocylindria bacterium]|jgi:hypothetical protein